MVLFAGRYNNSENLTGSEKVAKRIFRLHIKEECAIFVQYFFDGNRYNIFKKLFGREIKKLNDSSYVITLGLFRILFFPFRCKPSVIHIITFERFAILLYFYKLFSKARYVFNVHGIVTFGNYELKKLTFYYRLKDKFCEKIFLKFSDIIVFPSPNYTGLAKKYFNFKEDKVRIVPNGCDNEFHEALREESRGNKLSTAILIDKIGIKDSIEFISNTLKNIGDKLDIFEIGSLDGNKPKNNVLANGKIFERMGTKDFSVFLSGMDIFLSLNRYDTFSISALEAMGAGAIPIVTGDTGLSSYIQNGENGFIVPFGNSDKLEEIILTLYNNAVLRRSVSNKARNIYGKLNWGNIYKYYTAIYNYTL